MKDTKRIMLNIAAAGVLCFFVSCEDDNDKPQAGIVGRWEIDYVIVDGVSYPSTAQNFTIEFKNNNSFTWSRTSDGVTASGGGTYEYADGILTTVESGITTKLLCEITGDEMRLTNMDRPSETLVYKRQ